MAKSKKETISKSDHLDETGNVIDMSKEPKKIKSEYPKPFQAKGEFEMEEISEGKILISYKNDSKKIKIRVVSKDSL